MAAEKKPRGNGLKKIKIDFAKVKDMKLSEVYGTEPIPASDLAKRIWNLIKTHDLKVKKNA